MSRYIDADALREHLQNKLKTDYEMGLYNHGALTENFLRFVERQPTADVALKREFAMEIFAEIEEFMIDSTIYKMPAKSMLSSKFAELRNKYERGVDE